MVLSSKTLFCLLLLILPYTNASCASEFERPVLVHLLFSLQDRAVVEAVAQNVLRACLGKMQRSSSTGSEQACRAAVPYRLRTYQVAWPRKRLGHPRRAIPPLPFPKRSGIKSGYQEAAPNPFLGL